MHNMIFKYLINNNEFIFKIDPTKKVMNFE